MIKLSCIYKMWFNDPNKFYIGSTNDIWKRSKQHKSSLILNKHRNRHLQRAYNKYQCDLTFEILEVTDDLIVREQYYIDNLNPHYNIMKKAYSTSGYTFSKEARGKISKAAKNRWKNSAFKENFRIKIAKLNPLEVREIKLMLREGLSLETCASKYNVSRSAIQFIRDGRTWKNVII
jgi:group I intron endonuclease